MNGDATIVWGVLGFISGLASGAWLVNHFMVDPLIKIAQDLLSKRQTDLHLVPKRTVPNPHIARELSRRGGMRFLWKLCEHIEWTPVVQRATLYLAPDYRASRISGRPPK